MKHRILLFVIILFQPIMLNAQTGLNRANWKLSALQAVDTQNDAELENDLLNTIDYLNAISVAPSTSRSISVQLNAMNNNGMFIYNIQNDLTNVVVSTYTSTNSTDGINGTWTSLPANYIFDKNGALQRANIPKLSANNWFRIEFSNTGVNQIAIKEIGMYEFHTTGKNNYGFFLEPR